MEAHGHGGHLRLKAKISHGHQETGFQYSGHHNFYQSTNGEIRAHGEIEASQGNGHSHISCESSISSTYYPSENTKLEGKSSAKAEISTGIQENSLEVDMKIGVKASLGSTTSRSSGGNVYKNGVEVGYGSSASGKLSIGQNNVMDFHVHSGPYAKVFHETESEDRRFSYGGSLSSGGLDTNLKFDTEINREKESIKWKGEIAGRMGVGVGVKAKGEIVNPLGPYERELIRQGKCDEAAKSFLEKCIDQRTNFAKMALKETVTHLALPPKVERGAEILIDSLVDLAGGKWKGRRQWIVAKLFKRLSKYL